MKGFTTYIFPALGCCILQRRVTLDILQVNVCTPTDKQPDDIQPPGRGSEDQRCHVHLENHNTIHPLQFTLQKRTLFCHYYAIYVSRVTTHRVSPRYPNSEMLKKSAAGLPTKFKISSFCDVLDTTKKLVLNPAFWIKQLKPSFISLTCVLCNTLQNSKQQAYS